MFIVQNVVFSFSSLPEHLFYQVDGSDFNCVKKDNSIVIESFDGELTARENIFLNGALLGHKKSFMQQHFDEIIEFSELQDFVDVPIKNFSSGMAARLGFAVATIVKPDILIVDEVLAVGDHAFQEKCKKRMEEMLKGGTTLLFVSHSAEQVKELCENVVWIDKGVVKMSGKATEVISFYEAD